MAKCISRKESMCSSDFSPHTPILFQLLERYRPNICWQNWDIVSLTDSNLVDTWVVSLVQRSQLVTKFYSGHIGKIYRKLLECPTYSSRWQYLVNKKSFWRSPGLKTKFFLGLFRFLEDIVFSVTRRSRSNGSHSLTESLSHWVTVSRLD